MNKKRNFPSATFSSTFLIWFEIKSSILPSFTQCDLLRILKRCGSVNVGDWEGSLHDSNLFLFLRFIEHSVTGLSYFIFVWIELFSIHRASTACIWLCVNIFLKWWWKTFSCTFRKEEGWGSEKNGKIFVEVQRKFLFCSFLSFDKLTYSINIDGVSRCPLYGITTYVHTKIFQFI